MRRILIIIGIIGICACIAAVSYVEIRGKDAPLAPSSMTDFIGYRSKLIRVNGQSVRVAIADTPPLQSLGLGDRDRLPDGEGMLFVFSEDKKYAFWMKDMRFSIDMLWISYDGAIVYMAQNVSPETYPEDFVPTLPARYVLELPANYARDHEFKMGDFVQL